MLVLPYLCMEKKKDRSLLTRTNLTVLRLTDEGLPGLGVLALPPGVRPAHHHSVGFHSSQAAGLDHVANTFTRLLSHDTLTEALHTLLIHEVLQSLK